MSLASGRSLAAGMLAVLLLTAAGCSEESAPPPVPPPPGAAHLIELLPADGQVGEWKQIDPPPAYYDPRKPVAPSDPDAPLPGLGFDRRAKAVVRCPYGQDEDGDRVVLIDLVEFPDAATAQAVLGEFYDSNAELGALGETSLWTTEEVQPAVAARAAEAGRPAVPGRPAILRANFMSAKAHFIVVAQSDRAAGDWVGDVRRLGQAVVGNIHRTAPRPPAVPRPTPPEPIPQPAPTRPAPPTRPTPPPPPPPPATRPTTWPDHDELGPIVG